MTEAAKLALLTLALQFVGALIIARLAVRWALTRYKSEKMWERRLAAFVDVLAALGDMRLVVGRWHDELIGAHETTPDQDEMQRVRYQAARRRLDEGIATAALILPPNSAALLAGLDRALETSRRGQDQVDDLDRQYGVLDRAITQLVLQGRSALEVSSPLPKEDGQKSLAPELSSLEK